jgi:hypothetical protein
MHHPAVFQQLVSADAYGYVKIFHIFSGCSILTSWKWATEGCQKKE